jgi:hypothetical protein
MAKLDLTALVYSSSTKELDNLRAALEPVVGRYREATSFGEACSKAKNEKVDFAVIGCETEALREYLEFAPFARSEPNLKSCSIFLWAPCEPSAKDADPAIRFIERGKYRLLVESLDELGAQESLEEIARKTKQALPVFMQNFAKLASENLSSPLGLKLLSPGWTPGVPSPKDIRATVSSRTRLLHADWIFAAAVKTPTPEILEKVLRETLLGAAQKTVLSVPVKLKYFQMEMAPTIAEMNFSDSWNSLPLLNSSQELVAQIFVKIRPRT